jgi:hypothetical protein
MGAHRIVAMTKIEELNQRNIDMTLLFVEGCSSREKPSISDVTCGNGNPIVSGSFDKNSTNDFGFFLPTFAGSQNHRLIVRHPAIPVNFVEIAEKQRNRIEQIRQS